MNERRKTPAESLMEQKWSKANADRGFNHFEVHIFIFIYAMNKFPTMIVVFPLASMDHQIKESFSATL